MYTLKKSLGQHFLHDEQMVLKIISALKEQSFKRLLEVGPGGGALTKHLLNLEGIAFKAVELDVEKVAWLTSQYPSLKDKLIHQDFLEMSPPFSEPFTIIGNFPYNISSQILFKVLDWRELVECLIGMFQKEVAQRVAAPEGSKTYGILSVLVQAFYKVDYLFEVHEKCFTPPPKVKSAVIRLMPRSEIPPMRTEKDLRILVKTAFNQRRKTLRNATRGLFSDETLKRELFNKRAEQLSVNEFAQLTFDMK